MIRKLITADLFKLSRIIKKMDIKKDIEGLARDTSGLSDEEKKKAEQQLKIDLTLLFVENIGNAEQECYKLLADLSGKKPDEIEKQPPEDTLNVLKELFQQEGFDSFFSTAVKSTQ